jgi:phospholipid/cholesterol/gamma-HCH transport system substrate-binding protein
VRRSWAAVTVGALVLIVSAISYFLIRSTSERTASTQGISVWAIFHDASGLFEKSRVQTAGISIGQIDERKLQPNTALAKITIHIQPGITLWSNAMVSKKSASLLGEYYLEIDPGTPFALVNGEKQQMTQLKTGDEIKAVREPAVMGDLMNDIGTILPILKDILQDVHKLTSNQLTDIATNVDKLIETNSITDPARARSSRPARRCVARWPSCRGPSTTSTRPCATSRASPRASTRGRAPRGAC